MKNKIQDDLPFAGGTPGLSAIIPGGRLDGTIRASLSLASHSPEKPGDHEWQPGGLCGSATIERVHGKGMS